MTIVEELRAKISRDNRELLDRAADEIERLTLENEKLKMGRSVKKVKWRWDCGCFLPFCPYCGEPIYEEYDTERCYFCGLPFKWKDRSKSRKVIVGKYEVVQTSSNAIYITDTEVNRVVLHASCTKKKSKRQLRRMVEGLESLRDFERRADNEQREAD